MIDSKDGIIGLAIGDAMGVPLEFCTREELMVNPITEMLGYGSHDVPKGCWSDDTSMTLCLIDAINSSKQIIPDDIAANFVRWIENEEFTATGEKFDIGRTTLYAIMNFERGTKATESGLDDELSNGNGSLMRIAPLIYYCYSNKLNEDEIYRIVNNVSSITHKHEVSIMGCFMYVLFGIELLKNKNLKQAYQKIKETNYTMFSEDCILKYNRIIENEIDKYQLDEIKSTGYVVDTLEATLWTLLTTDSYDSSIIKAINLGEDTDTVGACVGGLAGIYYGLEKINEKWKKTLLKYDYIEELCNTYNNILNN